jgi:very-short-patch-repair endonuclease
VLDRLDAVLAAANGVTTRAELVAALGHHAADSAVRRGDIVRVQPRVYSRPWDADDPRIRRLAALRFAGPGAAITHLTAVRDWNLLPPDEAAPIDVTVPGTRLPRGGQRLSVHRSRVRLPAVPLGGISVVRREWAVLQSWPESSGPDQRAPLLTGARAGVLDLGVLSSAVDLSPNLAGRARLLHAIELIASGCQSELELWGFQSVFDEPGLRGARRQLEIRVGGRRFRLDMAYETERVAVELDGRAYHASPAQWERDIARDLALATVGWQTIRLSHRRLTTDVAGCRRDVLRVLATRRRGGPVSA